MRSAKEWLQHLICLLAFVLTGCLAMAQTVHFTATPTAGCSPLAVNFTNTSTGFSGNATYNWDFGNGNTSTLKDNVGAQYKDEHDYTVTLTVTDNGQTYATSTTITVYKKPVVDFSTDATKGCLPLPVHFTSNSTPGDGSIANYFWDFGNGATASGTQQTVHTYQTATNVSASLTVTNSFGCYSTLTKPDIIQVLPAVKADFTALQTVVCQVNDVVSFINKSSGGGTLSYNWDFGDNTTSAVLNPVHKYNQKGSYTVKLNVKNSDGCTADTTVPAYINVADYNTDFDVPPLICENTSTIFKDRSTPQPIYTQQLWTIDGAIYHVDTSFFAASFTKGTHTVQLVTQFGNCLDTATKTIMVLEKPTTNDFIINKQSTCGAPATVQFTDTTQSAVKWEWYLDNTPDNSSTPSGTTSYVSHTYNANGIYYAWLITTNAAGCSTEIEQPVDIHNPNATINSSAGQYGCDSLTTVFSASSPDSIKDFVWNFNDGTPASTQPTPKHIFTHAGDYQVTLNFTTADGCTGTAQYDVHVTPKPKFDFTAVPGATICGSTPVSFIVTGTNLDGYYYWNYGDQLGYYSGTINGIHQYYFDSVYTVSLIISKQGCTDTVTKTNYITVLPPFPHISNQANTCDGTRGLVTFEDASVKATAWSWDFGDGSPAYTYNSPQTTIAHTYLQSGTYPVRLTTKNGNCTVSDSANVFVLLKQSPILASALSEICGNANLPVLVSNLDTNPAAQYFSYNHDVDIYGAEYRDGSMFAGSYTSPDGSWRNTFHLDLTDFDNTKKDLRLITNSYYFNCLDTTNYIPVKVKGPKAGFTVANSCFKEPFHFSDTSKGSNGATIVKWEWNFGDNTSAIKLNSKDFDYQYQNPGMYNVLLTVTDADGCIDTAQQNNLAANGPQAAFTISDNPAMPSTDVYFSNTSNINGSNYEDNLFTWLFGDGQQTRNVYIDSSVVHNYASKGVDTVLLIAKNSLTKCADTAIQYLYIKNPALDFTYTTEFINPSSGCPPMLATFTNASLNTANVSWNFGDGTTASNINFATHIYDKPGKYKVTLYGYFFDNSLDSIFQYITIQGPYATLKADKLFTCGAAPITLGATAANTVSYTWDFGDGTLTDAVDTFAVHNYLTPGMYTPSLIVKDNNNCSFPYFLDKPVIIDTLHLAIHTKPSIVCDSSFTLFTPDIVSIAKDQVHVPLQYHWSFGTGNSKDTANIEAPSFMYSKTGTYPAVFSAVSPYGCSAQVSAAIVVNPTPMAGIKGPATLCQDDIGNFTGTADVNSVTWEWHFPNGNTATIQKPAQQSFTLLGTDSVRLIINNKGCFDTAYNPLTIYAKPIVNIQPVLPQICAGQTVQLQAHDGIEYKWLPNQNIDGNTIASPLVAPAKTTVYKVNVTNSNGCVNTDSVLVRVVQPFTIAATPLLYVCRGSTAQLTASGAAIYKWIEGTNLNSIDIANPITSTTTPQTYKVVGYDSAHCFTDTATTEVRIAELPTVKAGNDITTLAGSPVTLSASTSPDVTGWNWQPPTYLNCTNCPLPVSTPQSNIVYTVQVNNTYGCIASDNMAVNVLCRQSLVQLPSAFTPNGDGINERFSIKGNGIKNINRFAVFNRDGQLLFERTNMSANDANAGWDGTFSGKPMAPGTYVYMAEIVCATGEVYHYKGTVVLIR